MTAVFTPSTLDTGQDAAITLRAAPDAQPGVYQVRVVGTGANHSAAGGFTLTLRPDDPPVGFAIGASPVTVEAGRQATTPVWSSGQGGQITLRASGLPSGVSAAFQPNPIAIGSTSTLTFTAAPTATTGTSTVVLTGTDATGRPARAEILFTVTAPALRVTATPDSATTRRGGLTATTAAATEPAVFSATGVPAGTSVHWHQRGSTATAYFFTTFQTPLGAHPVTVTATAADGRSATTTFTLTVTRW
ncbi:hypothetical protein ACFQV2_33120 [Actinokineospora soli]|uniref:Ig-like domain (Group 3) n=1 Tax=Actinokineospora soli TaxID=1048753 RepID=A0ABW2TUN7_9PSEU